jgi:hypothetical protein
MTPTNVGALEAARTFLQRGWYPVPVPAGQKGPVLDGWQDLRLNDSELVEHFSAASNVGLILGEASGGLVDVDIDHPSALGLTHLLPKTERIHGRSMKPVSHYWYRCADNVPKTKQFRDPVTREMLVELRSTGGQTVVPPSVYAQSGVEDRLIWVSHGDPAVIGADELFRAVSDIAATALLAKHYPRTSGSRHDIALAIAGFLLRGGTTQARAEQLVEAMCEVAGDEEVQDRLKAVADTAERLKTGQPATGRHRLSDYFDKRVLKAAEEWLGFHTQEEFGWDVPVPFDELRTPEIFADVLPEPYAAFARELAEAAEVPASMTVMATLGAAAAAVTKKFVVTPKAGWLEPTNIYVMVALPPANNKSLVLREAMDPIEGWELERQGAMREEIRLAATARKNEESMIAGLRGRAARKEKLEDREHLFAEVARIEANLTAVPVPPKVYLNDVTPESLASALAEQDGKIGIISDEGGFTETIAGLYSAGHANYDIVLKGWDGGRVRLKRKDQEFDVRPYITVLLLVQPQVLRNMANQKALKGRGLLERFLFALPNSKLGHRTLDTKPIDVEVRRTYARALRKLLDIPVRKSALGVDEPRLLTLSKDALSKLNDFRKELEPQLGRDGRLSVCAGWGGKAAGNCTRIAGLLHILEHGESFSEIHARTMDRAVTICRALLEHALAAWSMMQVDQAIQDAAEVCQWILARGEPKLGRTECLRKFHGRFTNKKRYEAALDTLRHHNIISDSRAQADPGTGRTRKYYDVNPMLFDRKS